MIRLIAAIDSKRGIAKDGGMPWKIPEDEAYFTEETKKYGGNVLSGSTTFREAYKSKPLAGRQNYILTHDDSPIAGVTLIHDLDKFLEEFKDKDLWVAGGGKVFGQVIEAGQADELYLTEIEGDFECDTFFPDYNGFELVSKSELRQQNGYKFRYAIYKKPSDDARA